MRRAPLLCLSLLLAPGCGAKKASFSYDGQVQAVAGGATLALDPRQLVWQVDGMHEVDGEHYRQAVLQELAAKGFRPGSPDSADLWLDVVVLAPGQARSEAPELRGKGGPAASGGPGSGRGRGRGMAEGGRGSGGGEAPADREPESRERTVIVKLVAREGGRTLWTAAVAIPPHKPGKGRPVLEEDWMRRLLEPLPAQPR